MKGIYFTAGSSITQLETLPDRIYDTPMLNYTRGSEENV